MTRATAYSANYPLIRRYQAQFERFVSLTASAATAKRYSASLNVFFDYFKDKKEPGDFSKMDVEDFRAYRRKAKVSARATNYDIQVVRRFWNWMLDNEVASFNPASAVKKLREEEVARHSLGAAEQDKLYSVCLNDQERLLVGLALTTGLRGKTLSELETTDFHLGEGFMILSPKKLKARRAHELPIRKKELELIGKLEKGGLWGDWAKTPRALEYRFNKILQRAELPYRGLRIARRTTATTLLRNGVDVRMVKDWLGHKDISTTAKYLTPATSSELRSALTKLPKG